MSDQAESRWSALDDDDVDAGENFEVQPDDEMMMKPDLNVSDTEDQQSSKHTSRKFRKSGLGGLRRGGVKRRRSPMWKFFVCRGSSMVCKLCGKCMKWSEGNTSNMYNHLRSVHQKEYTAAMQQYRASLTSHMVGLTCHDY